MKADLLERMQNLEDEVRLQDSTLDARTRKLWGEIVKLQAEVKELRERTGTVAMSAREPRV